MRVSSPASVLAALALIGAGLAVTAVPGPAVGAGEVVPYPFKDDKVALTDTPSFPASLVTTGGRTAYASITKNGVVSQDFGLTTDDPGAFTDELRATWAQDLEYRELNEGVDLREAHAMTVGDLDGNATATDPKVNAVYLLTTLVGQPDQLVLTDDQSNGFGVLGTTEIADGALDVTMTEKSSTHAAVLFVRYRDRLDAYEYDATAPGRLAQVRLGSSVPLTGIQDVYHRPSWLDPDTKSSDLTAGALAVAIPVPNSPLEPFQGRLLQVEDRGTDGIFLMEQQGDVHASVYSQATTGWQSGQVRYDWLPGIRRLPGAIRDQQDFSMALTGRIGGVNHVFVGQTVASQFQQYEMQELADQNVCGDDVALDLDVARSANTTLVACAGVDEVVDGPDLLLQGILRAGRNGFQAGDAVRWSSTIAPQAVDGSAALRDPQVRAVAPCQWLHRAEDAGVTKKCSDDRSYNTLDRDSLKAGNAAVQTTVAGGADGTSLAQAYQTSAAFLDVAPSTVNKSGLFWWSRMGGVAAPVNDAFPLLSEPLPATRNEVVAEVPNDPIGSPPVRTSTDPIPVAFLPAPPQVAGAEQASDAPEFAAVTRSTNGSSNSTSTNISASIGFSYETPLSGYGASVSATLSNEVTDESSVERTVATSQTFRGLVDDDVVVYRRVPLVRWAGTVVESSTGLGLGGPISIDLPDGNVFTSATSVEALAAQYPRLYGPDGDLAPVLARAFGHTVGDPGSYPRDTANNADVDAMCDGSVGSGGPRELPDIPIYMPKNPFSSDAASTPKQPDVIMSEVHDVVTGTGNAEGATFSLEDAYTNSRVQSSSYEISAEFKASYVTVGGSYGRSAGQSWSNTLATGVDFSSVIGHIPSKNPALASEKYSWRSFLCQVTTQATTGEPVTAWTLDYATKGYNGSGGMRPLAPVVATGPVRSAAAPATGAVLRWEQATGTVQDYDWTVEAIGKADVRTGQVAYATPKESNATNPLAHAVPVPGTLLPGQLYRWKVDATDFFGNTVSSDWEYFVTNADGGSGTSGSTSAGPTALTDRVTTVEDKAVTIAAGANDQNPAGGALSLAVSSPPLRGAVTVNGGVLRYEPTKDACGLDAFDYTVTDANGRTSTATDIVKVDCVNDAPTIVNDRVRMAKGDRTLRLLAPGPLGNDSDVDGDTLIAKLLTKKPSWGRVRLGSNGALLVRLKKGSSQPESVTVRYRACDASGACSGTGKITVVSG